MLYNTRKSLKVLRYSSGNIVQNGMDGEDIRIRRKNKGTGETLQGEYQGLLKW